MDLAHISQLTTLALALSLLIGLILGALMQRTHFCTMGAVADIANFGSWARARMFGLALGVAIVGTQGMANAGLIDLSKSIYLSGRVAWLAYALGGAFFGYITTRKCKI